MVLRFLFMFFIVIAPGTSYSFSFGILRGNSIDHQPLNDTNLLYLPGGLKRPQSSHILPGAGGGSGDEDDDSRRKKPPFFITPDLPFMAKGESGFGQILDEIVRRLELPLSEEEKQEQEAYLDQLEADLREYRQQQQQAELLGQLASDFSFSHYPGYQDSGGSGKASYTVPGIMSLPTTSGSQTARGATGEAGSGGGGQSGSTGQEEPSRGAGGTKGSGSPGNNPPAQHNKKRTTEATKDYLKKEVESEGKVYIFQTEIKGLASCFQCPVCFELVDYKNNRIDTCSVCENAYCHGCFSQLGKPEKCVNRCKLDEPEEGKNKNNNEKKELWQKRGVRLLNQIEWECVSCGAESITIPDMEAHIKKCGKIFCCSHPGCNFSGSESDLNAHNGVCEYRPVKIGPYEFPHYQAAFIQERAVEVPEGLDTSSWPDGAAIWLLLDAIEAQPQPQSPAERCPVCYLWIATSAWAAHKAACEKAHVQCRFCSATIQRGLVKQHEREKCDAAFEQCECSEDVLLKFKDKHDRLECKKRLVQCENAPDCTESFRFDESDAHYAECPYKKMICPGCSAKDSAYLLKALHPCQDIRIIDGMTLTRQAIATPVPVYQTTDGCFVYMELPVSYIGSFPPFSFHLSGYSFSLMPGFEAGILELKVSHEYSDNLMKVYISKLIITLHNDHGEQFSEIAQMYRTSVLAEYSLVPSPHVYKSGLKTEKIILKMKKRNEPCWYNLWGIFGRPRSFPE